MINFDDILFFALYYKAYLIPLVLVIGIASAWLLYKNKPHNLLLAAVISLFPYILVRYAGGGVTEYLFCLFVPSILVMCLVLYRLDRQKKPEKMNPPYNVPLHTTDGRTLYIADANRGIMVSGSTGSGKTAGPITAIMKHFANMKFAGILHDYKEYELTEVAYPLFKEQGINFQVFAPHDVNRSIRLNVVAPHLIDTEAKLNGIIKTLVLNLGQDESDSDAGKFFRDGEESLLSAVIWRLKKDYPEKCNLPFAIALLLSAQNHHEKVTQPNGMILIKPYQKLIDFICQDHRAEILGSVFLTGISNERQTGSLYSTLAANLRQVATPELFYLLSGHDLDLDLNSDQNRTVLSFVNKPGYLEKTISPVNAMLMQSVLSSMSERGRKPSFAIIDEAPMVKMIDLPSQIRTLRSFGMSFTYCLQDKVAGVAQFGGKEYKVKDILTNLSTQFMGKVNDPETAKHYERYLEIIKEEQVSKSYRSGNFLTSRDGGDSITKSTRDKSKIQAFEFFKLTQGEFIMFSDGRDKRFTFDYKQPITELPPMRGSVTSIDLEDNYNRILDEARDFFN